MLEAQRYAIGVDLGGTNLRAALLDVSSGQLSSLRSTPTLGREGFEAVITRMAALIQEVIADSPIPANQINSAGIGVPGMADLEHGETLFLPNLPGQWRGVPLARLVSSATWLPVRLLNDVRAMTLGEWAFGAGRGVETMACFAVGTGIGGGLVIGGRLHLGYNGTAGELGHQVVEPNGLVCGCGGRGCLETVASGPAIASQGARAVMQGLTTAIAELAGFDLNRITPEVVCQAAQQGDPVALEIYERAGTYLGIGVANVVTALAPQRVVIGGGVAQAGELLLGPVRRTVRERVHLTPVERVEIVPAELGTNAGLVGAAYWSLISDAILA